MTTSVESSCSNMDVRISLSVSLLRDQLRVVIEQAVANAVETVLEEMLKAVGFKFEEFGKEMTAKERENESIRKMLEISRCQMKTMRKYLSAVYAKDERQVPVNQKFGKQSEPNRTVCPYGRELNPLSNIHRTSREGDGNVILYGRTDKLLNDNQPPSLSEGLDGATQMQDGTAVKDQELAVRKSQDACGFDHNVHEKEDLTHVKEEHRDPLEGSGGCQSEGENCETELSLGGSTEIPDFDNPSLHEPNGIAAVTPGASPLAKEEEPEMELICIKEEPLEMEMHTLSPHPPEHLNDPSHASGSGWDSTGQAAGPVGAALTAMSSSTCMRYLQKNAATGDLERGLKNKWRWQWLEETDSQGQSYDLWLAKVDIPGMAWCKLCNKKIAYAQNGKKVFARHTEDHNHRGMVNQHKLR